MPLHGRKQRAAVILLKQNVVRETELNARFTHDIFVGDSFSDRISATFPGGPTAIVFR
jgi:hypothetical protein